MPLSVRAVSAFLGMRVASVLAQSRQHMRYYDTVL
jgi:hypothetical protein